jgi:hypothetical protein
MSTVNWYLAMCGVLKDPEICEFLRKLEQVHFAIYLYMYFLYFTEFLKIDSD